MYKAIILIFSLFTAHGIFCEPLDISTIDFDGVNINASSDKIDEDKTNFNIVYSPILPAGGIYSAKDKATGKEVVIQIGYARVDKSPYILYLPEHIFNFFSQGHDNKKTDKFKLRLNFLAWNKDEEKGIGLDITDLIVMPEDSYKYIGNNGKDKYYIQLGAFSYYQNSYELINNLFHMLEVVPKFYIIKIDIKAGRETTEMYKILAGPYSIENAQNISQKINSSRKAKVYINSGESILKEAEK